MKTRALTAAIVLLAAGSALAESRTFASTQVFGLASGGTFVLDNHSGNVVVVAKDTPNVEARLFKTIEGSDTGAIAEGNRHTRMIIGGDDNLRTVRMAIAAGSSKEFRASVAWRLNVPRNANLRIYTRYGDHIQVSGMRGTLVIKNINGRIMLDDISGSARIESVNGSIFYTAPELRGNILLSTVNGDVTATLPPDAGFRWIAETLKGDIVTNLPARGTFFGNTFRGTVNAPGGPTVTMGALTGNIRLYASGQQVRTAQSLERAKSMSAPSLVASGPPVPVIRGLFKYACSVCDVRVQQVAGDVDITIGAGEVQLGAVSGSSTVRSQGGPLQLGELLGVTNLRTRAGDILVDSAARGGTIATQGGTIRLLYTSGPTVLYSGGGDIIVRQASSTVDAQTVSGDIAISVDGRARSQKIDAKTGKGNVVLHVVPQFAADIEATILTSDPDGDTIVSDIPGLSLSRDQVGGRTRIRATGKINGGGAKVVLNATDGDIRISTGPVAPTVVTRR